MTGHSGSAVPQTLLAEGELARFYSVRKAALVSSGSSGLACAMLAAGVAPGDRVIVPANAWVACAASILLIGGHPVLADVDPETHCLCPNALARALTPQVRAVIAVNQNGHVANWDHHYAVCADAGVSLIEDCSHSHGVREQVGSSSFTVRVFSTQQTKLLTTGEGGFVLVEDEALAERIARIRASGRLHRWGEQRLLQDERFSGVGHNFTGSEFQAALTRAGLATLEQEHFVRQKNAAWLCGALECIPGWRVVGVNGVNAHHKFVLQSDVVPGRGADWFCAALSAETGIRWARIHPPLNENELLLGRFDRDQHPIAMRSWEESVCFRHQYLLAPPESLAVILEALKKVADHL